ncbi:MAG: TRAP transporter substrate-binding protein [Chloroflexota bacterium]
MSDRESKRISRRQLLAGAAVGIAGAAVSACTSPPPAATPGAAAKAPQAAQAPTDNVYTLKMQSTWTATDWHQQNPAGFVDKVQKMSAGRLKIELLPAGAVVPAMELLDAVHKGILDAGNGWPGYWYGKHPAATLFGSVPGGPYGMNAEDFLSWMYVGGGVQLYNDLLQKELKLDLVVFPSFGETPEPLGWFGKPIKTVAEFKGLKFRAGGMSSEVFKAMGMSVVTLAGGEIVPALERGTIDAAEYSDPTSDMSVGFHEVRKFYHLPSVHQPTGIMENFFNLKKWNELPDDLKAIVEYSSQAETMNYVARMLDRNSKDLKTLVDKGVQVVETPSEIMQEILKAWDKVAEQKSKENPFFAKVLQSQKEWAHRIVPYRRVGHPDYSVAADYYWGQDNVYKVVKP